MEETQDIEFPRPPFLVERRSGYLEYQMPISVKLIVDVDGRIPFLRNERNEWELPGGKLEVGESPEGAAQREVAEELGVVVTPSAIVSAWVYEITPLRHVFVVTYGAVYEGEVEDFRSPEGNEMRMVRYDEVDALRMPQQYKRAVSRWLSWR